MVTRKTKFKISIKELSFEFEGSQEIGLEIQQGIQQSLGNLMNTQARVLAHQETPEGIPAPILPVVPLLDNVSQPTASPNGDKPKQPRQRRQKGGASVTNLLSVLKQEQFFSQPQTGGDVMARLKDKGHHFAESSVLTQLQRMTQKDELYREYNSDNVYVYKDKPFHENSRSPSPPDPTLQ